MAEDVDEHLTLRFEPCRTFGEECGVTFHMFEHLDGEDVGESEGGE